jgi:6-methylsalicylate decarboxylase
MTTLPRTDVHQHLWPPELLAALERRSEPPFARRDAGAWRLHVPGEPAATVAAQEGADRAGGLAAQGVDRALLSLSTALQVEALAPREAAPLLDAWRAVVHGLPSALGAWGTLNLQGARPDDVDALLDEGFVGLCLPAGALAHPRRVERLADLLGRLEARDAPLFVHPGPAAGDDGDAAPWWPALTSYTASLQAAWWAWADAGLDRHPRLRVVFAALAGLAPLHGERAATRGGPAVPSAPRLFYETSSYGPQAVALMRRAVGAAQLVHGSDVPVVRGAPPQDDEALLRTNPARLLG